MPRTSQSLTLPTSDCQPQDEAWPGSQRLQIKLTYQHTHSSSQLHHKRMVYTTHKGNIPKLYSSGDQGNSATESHTGWLLHKITHSRSGNVSIYLIHTNKHGELSKMKQQKNMFQTKGQSKTPEEKLSKVETSNLSNKQLKVIINKDTQRPQENRWTQWEV